MTRLLVDGVFFQLTNTGIARVWRMMLKLLVASGKFEVFLLDRGRAPRIEGVQLLPFPTYNMGFDSPADSELIQRFCDKYAIDIFTTTYYTSPLATPMVMMLYDMIPELFGFDLTFRDKIDKDLAISFAQRYVCISEMTRQDLLKFYPEIPSARVAVAHCGVDPLVFHTWSEAEVNAFREDFGLDKPYFLFVGSRSQATGYKNSQAFFDALEGWQDAHFDILCAGGEPKIEDAVRARLPLGVRCIRVDLTDEELSLAYAGAQALVYPSLYEGFGMPVVEAMASGCPVITTSHGSLPEAAGDAGHLISGLDIEEMRAAIRAMEDPGYRSDLISRGLRHAANFRWEDLANALMLQMERTLAESRTGSFDDFFKKWRELRAVQGSVDFALR